MMICHSDFQVELWESAGFLGLYAVYVVVVVVSDKCYFKVIVICTASFPPHPDDIVTRVLAFTATAPWRGR